MNHMTFDRAHRIGQKSGSRARPIVVKFHYYSEREAVRQSSFNFSEHLKSVNTGVGVQLPKAIRDARKPLYAKMKEAKDGGSNVRFVGKKLFIDSNEFVPAQPSTSGATGTSKWNIRGVRRSFLFFPGMSMDLYENCRTSTFLNLISRYDLVFMNETWISNHETINLDINGYCSANICGNKSKKTQQKVVSVVVFLLTFDQT